MAAFTLAPPARSLALSLLLAMAPLGAAHAQLSLGIQVGLPGVSIGVSMPSYPMLVRVPGYPVYYDPHGDNNYFFYDGLYWVYANDNWYASSWYNGPWELTSREYVPLYVLRIPVRYYRQPPVYFQGWSVDAPPRWDDHWGRDWVQRRPTWNQWDHQKAPKPAPLPRYQQKYPSDRYPSKVEQQRSIRTEQYRYVPREAVTRQHLKGAVPLPSQRRTTEPAKEPHARQPVRSTPKPKAAPRSTNRAPSREACRPGTPGCLPKRPPGQDKERKTSH